MSILIMRFSSLKYLEYESAYPPLLIYVCIRARVLTVGWNHQVCKEYTLTIKIHCC